MSLTFLSMNILNRLVNTVGPIVGLTLIKKVTNRLLMR